VVVALAVAAEADPAVREIADDHADDPGDRNRDQGRRQAALGKAVIDRLAADGDQRADDPIANQLAEGFARLRL